MKTPQPNHQQLIDQLNNIPTKEYNILEQGVTELKTILTHQDLLPANDPVWYDFIRNNNTGDHLRALRRSGYFDAMPDQESHTLSHLEQLTNLFSPLVAELIKDSREHHDQLSQINAILIILADKLPEEHQTRGKIDGLINKITDINAAKITPEEASRKLSESIKLVEAEIKKGQAADAKKLTAILSPRLVVAAKNNGNKFKKLFVQALEKSCSGEVLQVLISSGITMLPFDEIKKHYKKYDGSKKGEFSRPMSFLETLQLVADHDLGQNNDGELRIKRQEEIDQLKTSLKAVAIDYYRKEKPRHLVGIAELLKDFLDPSNPEVQAITPDLLLKIEKALQPGLDWSARFPDRTRSENFVSHNHPFIINVLNCAIKQSNLESVQRMLDLGCLQYDGVNDWIEKRDLLINDRADRTIDPERYLRQVSQLITSAEENVKNHQPHAAQILDIITRSVEKDLNHNPFFAGALTRQLLPESRDQVLEKIEEIKTTIAGSRQQFLEASPSTSPTVRTDGKATPIAPPSTSQLVK